MNKAKALEKIAEDIENCKVCKIGKVGQAVPGEGNPDADVVFVGEAPGRKEAETGRPFVGRSGQLLRSLIREIGLKENEVYITSPVKYLPKSGTPSSKDIEHGRMHLLKQLDIINPMIIVLLGSVAVRVVLNKKIPVLKNHGLIVEIKGKKYFITLHPAAVLRFQKFKKLLIEDFYKLKELIDKTIG